VLLGRTYDSGSMIPHNSSTLKGAVLRIFHIHCKRSILEEFDFVSRSRNRRFGFGSLSCQPPDTVPTSTDRNPWPIFVRSERYPIARIFETESTRDAKFFAQ
jgi:hypothetical protein